MSPDCVVCIPARNEAAVLPGLMAALGQQDGPGPLRVLVVANNCTDGTAEVLRGLGRRERRLALRVEEIALPADRATVGVARGTAMAAGAAWLREDGVADGVLIGTDADAVPPPHWVTANLRAVAAGAEAVGGAIRITEDPEHPLPGWLQDARARVAGYWAAVRALAHRVDPVAHDPPPRHGDHTGASLAVTVAAYEAAGGVPPLATGEDNALVAAIERNGGRLRHAPEVWTAVSAREEGRATGGMAAEMRRWRRLAETGAPHLLPGVPFWDAVFARRRALRDGYAGDLARAAAATGVPLPVLEAAARASVNAIAFVARAEPALPPLPAWEAEIVAATHALEARAADAAAA